MKVDVKRFSAKLESQMTQLMTDGAKIFVQKTASKVPVWSGMAAASLLPLAEVLGIHIKITPVDNAPNRIALGRSLSLGASFYNYFKGSLDYRYTFEFKSLVKHFAILDNPDNEPFDNILKYFKLKTPPPWEAIEYGIEAYRSFVKKNIKDYAPKVLESIQKYKITYR